MNPNTSESLRRAGDRRQEPRHRANFVAKMMLIGSHEDDYEEVTLIDLSESGLAFTTSRHLELGIQVEVQLDGCHLICEVRNSRYREYSNAPGYVVGVQIMAAPIGALAWRQLTKEYCAA